MPVLIAAQNADLDIVRAVASRLKRAGGEVRCYLEDDDYELREMGCKIAVGLLDDAYNLAGALTNVHTFMALMPDALSWNHRGDTEDIGQAWASAADEANIEQLVLAVSKRSGSSNAVMTAFRGVSKPLVIIETRLLVGQERPLQPGDGTKVFGLHIDELADILASVDDREDVLGSWGSDGWPIEVQARPDLPDDSDFVPDNSALQEFSPEGVTQTPRRE